MNVKLSILKSNNKGRKLKSNKNPMNYAFFSKSPFNFENEAKVISMVSNQEDTGMRIIQVLYFEPV